MWVFEYDPDSDETTVTWRSYSETFDGRVSGQSGGYPIGDSTNEAVNKLLQSINSIPEGLEATAEFRPGMIKYTTLES